MYILRFERTDPAYINSEVTKSKKEKLEFTLLDKDAEKIIKYLNPGNNSCSITVGDYDSYISFIDATNVYRYIRLCGWDEIYIYQKPVD